MSSPVAIVLAAGEGRRMHSDLAKVLHVAAGRPLVEWVLDAARVAGIGRLVVVVGYKAEQVRGALGGQADVSFAVQSEQLGTGHAVSMCRDGLSDHDGPIVVLNGDMPLIRGESIRSLLDAQRALRMARHNSDSWGIDPARLGIMGFSAGGHLASSAGTHFDAGKADAKDPIDRQSCRPDFLILCYAVIAFDEPYTHRGSQRNLLGADADRELVRSMSSEKQVSEKTPPTFLWHTSEDKGVPPENSVQFYLALQRAGVPAELHIFEKGRHGVGLARNIPGTSAWPDRCVDWLRVRGVLPNP